MTFFGKKSQKSAVKHSIENLFCLISWICLQPFVQDCVNLNKESKLEYFSKCESNNCKSFWVNCKPYLTNKHSKADTDIMLAENGELVLKNKDMRILLMIVLDLLSTNLAWITGKIISNHRRWVLIGLIISSNGIKTSPA